MLLNHKEHAPFKGFCYLRRKGGPFIHHLLAALLEIVKRWDSQGMD